MMPKSSGRVKPRRGAHDLRAADLHCRSAWPYGCLRYRRLGVHRLDPERSRPTDPCRGPPADAAEAAPADAFRIKALEAEVALLRAKVAAAPNARSGGEPTPRDEATLDADAVVLIERLHTIAGSDEAARISERCFANARRSGASHLAWYKACLRDERDRMRAAVRPRAGAVPSASFATPAPSSVHVCRRHGSPPYYVTAGELPRLRADGYNCRPMDL